MTTSSMYFHICFKPICQFTPSSFKPALQTNLAPHFEIFRNSANRSNPIKRDIIDLQAAVNEPLPSFSLIFLFHNSFHLSSAYSHQLLTRCHTHHYCYQIRNTKKLPCVPITLFHAALFSFLPRIKMRTPSGVTVTCFSSVWVTYMYIHIYVCVYIYI